MATYLGQIDCNIMLTSHARQAASPFGYKTHPHGLCKACIREIPTIRYHHTQATKIKRTHTTTHSSKSSVSLKVSTDMRMGAQIRVTTRYPYGSSGLKASAMSNLHRQTGEELELIKKNATPKDTTNAESAR